MTNFRIFLTQKITFLNPISWLLLRDYIQDIFHLKNNSILFYQMKTLSIYKTDTIFVFLVSKTVYVIILKIFQWCLTMAFLLIGLDIVQWISGKVPSRPLSDMEFSGNIGIRVTILINQSGKKLVEYSWKYWVLSVWTYLNI